MEVILRPVGLRDGKRVTSIKFLHFALLCRQKLPPSKNILCALQM